MTVLLWGCASNHNLSGEHISENDYSLEREDTDTNVTQEAGEAAGNNDKEQTGKISEPEEYTVQGYVLSVNDDIMYVDLENPGARNYPGEGEDRKVAFDISAAEQIQTASSDMNPLREHPVRGGVSVSIVYYIENNQNIAVSLSTNGEELPIIQYSSIGKVTGISDFGLTMQVTEGDYSGESIELNLSEYDINETEVSVNDVIWISYYKEKGVNYVVSIG